MPINTHKYARKIILHTLQDDTIVQVAVGGRVYGAHIKDADVESTLAAGPILIVALQAGSSAYSGTIARVGFDLWGYSATSSDEAIEAYNAGYEVLQAARVACPGVDLCGNAREVQRPEVGENVKHKAWYARGRWVMLSA